ncbi:MAG TPA: DUF411 domain-containing protein [Rhodocyclaceae bacterium]
MHRRIRLLPLMLVMMVGTALAQPIAEVFKSPYCGCCEDWVKHLRQNGFLVKTHDLENVSAARRQMGLPDRLSACHTAKIGGYVVEGHVPAADILKLLKEKPKALGLAVPSMPPGSPGMEGPRSIPYETLLVQADGSTTVFAKH